MSNCKKELEARRRVPRQASLDGIGISIFAQSEGAGWCDAATRQSPRIS
ncbi:Hypothetical protein P9303_05741 [Prochlorococcus marinus str. MIT 9303]|uniref:Uncharacterized protein n=1 Tax=Prochlorococcus marinus (strain MIT 9303) TaxID=59922 RepID=A2C766_PROM3|nr:Hypothetical protein P9303_05741 [Prochlorococcus marinus str. MIT 9303]